MGWLLIAVALAEVLTSVASDYSVFVYHFGHRGWPLGPVAVLLDFSFTPGLLLVPLVVLLFPDGRVGRRWKWVLRGGASRRNVVLLAGQVSVAAVCPPAARTGCGAGGGIIGGQHPGGFAAWVNVADVIHPCRCSRCCVSRQ